MMSNVRMDTKEAGAYIGIAPSTMRKWRVIPPKDPLPYLKINGRVLYDKDDLDALMARNRRFHTSAKAAA